MDESVNEIYEYNYQKIISRFKNRFGLLVLASLECPTLCHIPLKIQKTLEDGNFKSEKIINEKNLGTNIPLECFDYGNSIQTINIEKWEEKISTYKFHLELKIQYPSFLSETVREAILKVDQIGEQTTFTTDGDDMRKSATYRVDNENFDYELNP